MLVSLVEFIKEIQVFLFVAIVFLGVVITLEHRQKRLSVFKKRIASHLDIYSRSVRTGEGNKVTLLGRVYQDFQVRLTARVLIPSGLVGFFAHKLYGYAPLTFITSVIGIYIVSTVLSRQEAKKQILELEDRLPDAIEVFARAVSAGVPINRAVLSVGHAFEGLLGREFRRIYDALILGVPFQQAFEDSSKRVDSDSFGYFTAILCLNSETGGPLVEALNNLSQGLREKTKADRKMLALTAEPRISARIVTGIPVVLLSLQFAKQPDQVEFLFKDPSGQKILIYAVVSIIAGLFWIKRLARI
ncbi:membrane hypothetical protein [Vibrio nigripulchritudo MADA3029]|uniref:type II secretion system F family protein n=1 Tax=Vibrio nigripulchritudo TaxID=28173 RepID=UPI0003B191C3|nr:type II secretion system F family protein [Vibrio nigripulchritudo]CCN50446.1 membrane hypothetical protein [Vibrio nigripulchritudo MADA3020]CCN52397.1 membrane hypothetical protein [Vibrio nigripulchritudo MADA3021]CCN62224.1 membrane hypothetical protein [Vibrio nigripulchritudo MADA3029]